MRTRNRRSDESRLSLLSYVLLLTSIIIINILITAIIIIDINIIYKIHTVLLTEIMCFAMC